LPYTDSGGTKIRWESSGSPDAEPVLLVHGLGSALELWDHVTPALAERHHVLTYDNRGVGQSDVPKGPYDLAQMARDAMAVLDAAGVERAHVFGVSLGSMIAQHIALDHAARVRSLTLGCTICAGPDLVERAREVDEILMNRGRMDAETGIRAMLPHTFHPATPRARAERYVELRVRHATTAAGYYGQLEATMKLDTWKRLHEVDIPTLVIGGRADGLIPVGNSEDVARRIPGARLVVLEEASHIFWFDQPERTVELLLEWFAAH
jgi:pimeloyl-ACP methyl ester carboxylesterase